LGVFELEVLEMEAVNRFSIYQDKNFLRVVVLDSSLTVCQSLTAELRKDNHLVTCCTNLEESKQVVNTQKPDLLIIGYLGEVSSLELFREYSNQSEELPIILLTHTPEVNQFFRDWVIAHGGYDVVSWFAEKSDLLRESLQKLIRPDLIPQTLANNSVEVKAVVAPVPQPSPTAPPLSRNIQTPLVPVVEVKAVAAPAPQSNAAERIISGEIASEESESLQLPSERSLDVEEVVASVPKAIAVTSSQPLTYKQTLIALNQISESSLVYFGGLVIGNYWKKAHASLVQGHPELLSWSVNHNGVISYSGGSTPEESLTDAQFQSLKLLVKAFIKECDRIIGDYAELLQQSQPSAELVQMISS
jgi:hypothetical protein